jgi:aminopeptidase N/puromycin-sensitive aminopeptidase
VINFFATHKVESTERTLAKAIDSINDCIQLRSTQEQDLHSWLATQSK